jgi:VanZ family protein
VAAAGIAALDEWHQQFVPGRSASLGDWVADVAGAGIILLASGVLSWRRESR